MEGAWNAALSDSNLPASSVHLLLVPGSAVQDHNKAACYPPGKELIEEAGDLVSGSVLAEANSPEHIDQHRIAIYEDVDEADPVAFAILAGTLRHELRHAEQRVACGGVLFALDELAEQLVLWKVGGLPGGALLYQSKPIELDANAASARFLHRHFSDVVEKILEGPDAALARPNTPPGDLSDLSAKTVAFMFCLREVAEEPARFPSGLPFSARLRLIGPEWAELWERACATNTI
ncbi:MAG TPA: hypothetical protein VHV75_18660 [Solirubrobacteraceae bacterium]|jgi:hypothetical protein|nr:hypothetical protein [Solirubrobacteraceae bacterium]